MGKSARLACSGSLAPHIANYDCATAEIIIALHMHVMRCSLGHWLLCTVGLCKLHLGKP